MASSLSTTKAKLTNTAKLQGESWGADARVWATQLEPMQTPLWRLAIEEGAVGRGTRLLDAGCGAGGASVLAAAKGARVAGVDVAAALVDLAREAVPRGDFRVADVEDMPYLDGSFDVAFAMNVLQYVEDTMKAVHELRRVLAPEGALVVGTWGPPETSEASGLMKALGALTPPRTPPPTVLGLAGPGALEGVLEKGGFRVGPSRNVDAVWTFPDDDAFYRIFRASGPAQATIRAVGEEAVRSAILEAAAPFRHASGAYRFRNRFRTLVATP